ncbi:hypothetical protein HY625_03145 [Candidatus Uhrbacteria bacterium]|nr:hypothetical protein [Candidatus Uhrbacteria bacterium]
MRKILCLAAVTFTLISCGGRSGNHNAQPLTHQGTPDLLKQVVDQNGGTIEFNDPTSLYDELKITIPIGAMNQPATITANIPKNFTMPPIATLPIEFRPAGTVFAQPITMQIPYNPGLIQQGDDPQDLMMLIESTSGDVEVVLDPTIDATKKIATSTTTHFSLFDVLYPREFKLFRQPYLFIDSAPTNYEIAETFGYLSLYHAYHPLITKGASNKTITLGKGTQQSFFSTSDGNVLMIHGLFSTPADFRFDQNGNANDNDVLAMLKQNPDVHNILLYQYQSGWSVESNAKKLSEMIIANAQPNCRFTIIAHSMGGVVARTAIEKFGVLNAKNVITLGTPHEGGTLHNFTDFFAQFQIAAYVAKGVFPGLSDILSTSPFLTTLNTNFPGQKPSTTEYYLVAGRKFDNGTLLDHDGLVDTTSALSSILGVPQNHTFTVEKQDHNQLHSNARLNGVAVKIREWMSGVPNRPPDVNAGQDQTGAVNALFILAGTATDPDGDPIIKTEWRQISGPAAGLLNASFTATQAGDYVFEFIARDPLLTATDVVTITVNAPPPPPPPPVQRRAFSSTNTWCTNPQYPGSNLASFLASITVGQGFTGGASFDTILTTIPTTATVKSATVVFLTRTVWQSGYVTLSNGSKKTLAIFDAANASADVTAYVQSLVTTGAQNCDFILTASTAYVEYQINAVGGSDPWINVQWQ